MKTILLQFIFISVFSIVGSLTTLSAQSSSPTTIEMSDKASMRAPVFPKSGQTELDVCSLIEGKTYNFYYNGEHEISLDGTSFGIYVQVEATAECVTLQLRPKASQIDSQFEHDWLSAHCVDCKNTSRFQEIKNSLSLQAAPNQNAQELVQDIFIGGNCFETSNFSATSSFGLGTFAGGVPLFGFNDGIILSTGSVSDVGGPSSNFANSVTGSGSDSELNGISSPINDACVLEFDFVPTVDSVTFDFAFASEEYCTYIGSGFNDVFGFFLSGPGVGVNTNIALAPDGSPVTINTVNTVSNSNYFSPNGESCPGGGSGVFLTAFDGYTAAFKAIATVQPCETYHIKLAIGDVGDSAFDSAVFLKANSFDAGGAATGTADNASFFIESNDAYEGTDDCQQAYFRFTRESTDFLSPVIFDFEVGGTATQGVDYTDLPPSPITIPPGLPYIDVPITIIQDNIDEGTENILLFLYGACTCDVADVELFIHDTPEMEAVMDDIELCEDIPGLLNVIPVSGFEPYLYDWGSGPGPNPTVLIPPGSSGSTYTVSVTDLCGASTVVSADVTVSTLSGAIDGDVTLCGDGDSGEVEVSFTGEGPFSFTYLIDGDEDNPITVGNVTENPYSLAVQEVGEYELVIVQNQSCPGSTSGEAVVGVRVPAEIVADLEDASCTGSNTGSIDITVNNSFGAISYAWSNGSTLEDQAGLTAGDYTVTITDAGCEYVESYSLTENAPLEAELVAATGVDCANPTIGTVDINATGGSGGYTYIWNNGTTTEDLSGVSAGFYAVTVTDSDDCDFILSNLEVPGDDNTPTAEAIKSNDLDCNNVDATLTIGASNTGASFTYTWTDQDGDIVESGPDATQINVTTSGAYTLTVLNTDNGCFSDAAVNVTSNIEDPVSNAGSNQEINCFNSTVQLNGTASANGSDISYSWSGPAGSTILDGNTNVPTVDMEGEYTLTVMDASNGCSSQTTVNVTEDILDPIVSIVDPIAIDCNNSSLQIDASASSTGGFSYQWTTDNGSSIVGATTLTPTVSMPGNYTLEITNINNGCTSSQPVMVEDAFYYPTIDIASPATITCNITSTIIDATGSDATSGLQYQWTTLSGNGTLSDQNILNPSVDGGGEFRLRITDPTSGCFTELEVTVPENTSSPAFSVDAPDVFTCEDGNVTLNTNSTGNISFAWTITGGNATITDADTANPIIDAPGTFEVIATDNDNGCSSAQTIELVADTQTPVAEINLNHDLSCAQPQAIISGVGSSIGDDFIYTWEKDGVVLPDESNFTLQSVTESGEYTLIVTNSNNSCISEETVLVAIDTLAPAAVALTNDRLDCDTDEVLVEGTNSDQGANFSYQWSGNPDAFVGTTSDINATVNASDTYILTVTNNDNGCSTETTVFVDINEVAPAITIDQPDPIICTEETQIVESLVVTTEGNVNYSWSGSGILSGDDSSSPTVNEGGVYTLTATDPDNGCTTTQDITVDDDRVLPVANAGTDAVINCFEPTTELTASASTGIGELSYVWSTTGTGVIDTDIDLVNPTVSAPGVYTVVVTDASNNCEQTATVTITDDFTPPVASAGDDTQLDCGTTSLTLDGSGSSTGNIAYEWTASNGGAIQSGNENMANPVIIASGTYEVVVTNLDNGCTASDNVVVIDDASAPILNVVSEGDITCLDGSITLTATIDNTTNYDYTWTIENNDGNFETGVNTLTPVVDQPGTYTLSVINNDNDCETQFSIPVLQNTLDPTVELVANNIIDCNNPTTVINTAGSDVGTGYTLEWTSDNSVNIPTNTENPTVGEQGNYTLTITNTVNGCSTTMMTPVQEDLVDPQVSAVSDEIITCDQPAVPLVGTGSSTGNIYQYTWTYLVNGEVVGTDLNIATEEPGSYQLLVTNTQNGCTSVAETTVDINADFPDVEAGTAATLTCLIQDTELNGAGSAMGSNISYSWQVIEGTGNISDPTTLTPTIDAPGVYELTVTNNDNNCADSDTVEVPEDLSEPTLNITQPDIITCFVEVVDLTVNSPNGTGFVWSGIGNIENPNSATPSVDAAGTYTVTAAHDVTGCEASETVTVEDDIVLPTIEPGSDYLISCETGNAALVGTTNAENATFTWTDENGDEYNGANVAVEVPGTYILTVTNLDNNCSDSAETFVETQYPTDILASETDVDCISGYGRIQIEGVEGGTPGYSYSIDGGDTFTESTLFSQLDAGIYTVLVQDENGCEYDEEFEIRPEEILTVDMEPIVRLNLGETYQFNPLINKSEDILSSIVWSPSDSLSCGDCLQPEITAMESGRYYLNLKDSLGCTAEANTMLIVNKETRIYIPNAFSPNGDGENEIFMIYSDRNMIEEIISFEVYNRWGETVHNYYNFQPNNPLFGWDGTYRGQTMNPSVFAYVAQIKLVDGRIEVFKGDVTLQK